MLSFPPSPSVRIFVGRNPVDLRKGFDGLSGEVIGVVDEDPQSGHLFVFFNKRRNRIKLLYFDGTGLWVAAKRLEKGTFSWPKASRADQKKLKLDPQALQLILDGVDLRGASMRPWYERDGD